MNERFKFRIWDKIDKRFMSGSVSIDCRKGCMAGNMPENKYVIQQCTGLKDRNEKLIYEGDIIEWKKEKHIVIFDERNATFGIKISDVETHLFNDIHTPTRWIEIIGNIYENKELLEGKK